MLSILVETNRTRIEVQSTNGPLAYTTLITPCIIAALPVNCAKPTGVQSSFAVLSLPIVRGVVVCVGMNNESIGEWLGE